MNPTRIPEGVSRYIRYVNSVERLDRDQERDVANKWVQQRDPESGNRLVSANLRYVVGIAMGYQRYQVPLDELIAEGNLGLMQALKKFDPERGNRFVTYANHWIRACILRYIATSWSMVGGRGSLRTKMFYRLRKERAKLSAALGDEHEVMRQLADMLGVTVEKVRLLSAGLEGGDTSMEAPVGDTPLVFGDRFRCDRESPEEMVGRARWHAMAASHLRGAMGKLDRRERFIVERRLMADKDDMLTLEEIGQHFGISRERVRQIEVRTKYKLRQRLSQLEDVAA
jgi:RNA polymerase sigma-32 factor